MRPYRVGWRLRRARLIRVPWLNSLFKVVPKNPFHAVTEAKPGRTIQGIFGSLSTKRAGADKSEDMALSYGELERFYESFVSRARAGGIPCAITSGMACVNFGVAQTTRDCDVLCAWEAAERLLALLADFRLAGVTPAYRGNLSAPLDARWLRGGWTSHFVWNAADAEAYLDVFGVAPRGSSAWQSEVSGLYASLHTVAEMKRTDRDKDWPCVTALGLKLLEAGDARGWLHLFDADLMLELLTRVPCPAEMVARRPSLQLAVQGDGRLKQALRVEREFWEELDRARLRVYEQAVRPYHAAVRKARLPPDASLSAQHEARVQCAEQFLALNPLRVHGLEALIQESRTELLKLFPPALLEWLPDVRDNFRLLLE